MRKRSFTLCTLCGLALFSASCDFAVDLGTEQLFPTGSSFVISGTADFLDGDASCPIWIADNGVVYHLFQNPRLSNEEFDQVVTPGVRSRLELARRTDLVVTCQVGTIAEVQDVLEIVE